MGSKDTDSKGQGLSRRSFLKASAAAAAVGGMADWTFAAEKAMAYEGVAGYTVTTTTCPYCSASCGQRVVVDGSGDVVDIYGDFDSPFNSGGLCAKGAGSLQLVNNARRLGVGTGHASLSGSPLPAAFDETGSDVGYKRVGNGTWTSGALQTLMDEAATAMVAARAGNWPNADNDSDTVAFFGSSHMNNEPCYLYRKLIADFGTTNTEHQARI